MVEIWPFIAISVPTMIFLGMRHALDLDHITAIDSLVRLHNAIKKSRWVGTAFGAGHMASVLAEMILIIYMVGSITSAGSIGLWGSMIGAIALGAIGSTNIYSMKKLGKGGSAILASKILNSTGCLGPTGSSLVTGLVFGLGFDTATQISAITLSVAASATLSIQTALILAGVFAIGMISIDTLDSVILRSAFSKVLHTRGFRFTSYALSGAALFIASITSYETLASVEILPKIAGPVLAVAIVSSSLAYAFISKRRRLSIRNNTC